MAEVADGRRHSTAGRVATPKIGPVGGGVQAMGELDAALSKAVGARVRLSTSLPNGSVLEGTLFTACPITNLVAINTAPPPPNPSSALVGQPGDYHVIPVSRIQTFQLLGLPQDSVRAEESSPGFSGALPSIGKVDIKALEAREQAAIRKMKERDATRNRGVGREAQEIFDALARTLPTRWHDTSIVVNDAVIISKPYTIDDCAAPKDQQNALNRVRKVLEHERKKIAERAGRPGVATPIGPRKGG